MTKEDKELLLKDLCARLPYNFVYLYTNAPFADNKPIILTPVVISNLMNATEDLILKPYLRPMSSMTDEEKEDFGVFIHIQPKRYNGYTVNCSHYYTVSEIDWLNEHHFDYRGLIPIGLALEAPEDMYKTE